MAISGKDVQVWMWKVVKFSMGSAYTFVKNHPFIGCPLLFLLVLYIRFPPLFWISLYSSVFIILATRIYIRYRNAKSCRKDETKNDEESIRKEGSVRSVPKNRNSKYLVRARSVRRRKARETSRDSSVHTSEDEKNTIFSSSFNNDMVDKSALIDERPKEIREIEVDPVTSHPECSSSNDNLNESVLRPELDNTPFEGSRKLGGGGRDMEMESSGTDEEDEHEREANNKAVQWTEADQKNLMDLGFSEIERNKRLESLIARRRARKMLSLQVRRPVVNMMDTFEAHGPMTSLMIPRSYNPFLHSQSMGHFSPMPGSAPSVLLPNQNPFDLPYDPQEERPNLTGGSFHQEFDFTFSKPEGIGLGASVPGELKVDQQEISFSRNLTKEDEVSEDLQNSKIEGPLDEKTADRIIGVESCEAPEFEVDNARADEVIKEEVPYSKQGMDLIGNCEEENSSEVETKSVLIEDSVDKLSSEASSEDDKPVYRVDKEAVLKSLGRNTSVNREGSNQMGYIGNNYDPPVDMFRMSKMQEFLDNADKDMNHSHHASISSIASDLQVEVSEVSWSGLTDDGNISSPDEEIAMYKGDMESESTGGIEDIGATLSQLPRIDENEPKEVYGTNEDNTGVSRSKESENHVPHNGNISSPDEVSSAYKGDIESERNSGNEDTRETSSQLPQIDGNESKEVYDSNEDNTMEVGFSKTKESGNHVSDEFAEEVIEHNADNSVSLLAAKAEFLNQSQDPTSLIFQTNIEDKFQSSTSADLLHVLASDTSAFPVMDQMQHLEGDTMSNISQIDDPERTEQLLCSPDKPKGESSTMYNVDDTKLKEDNDKEFGIRETDDSVGLFNEQGTRNQPEKMEDHHNNILGLVGENSNPKISEEGRNVMDSSTAIKDNDAPGSTQVDESEGHGAEQRSSVVRPNFTDHQVRTLLPASVLQQFHIDSSISSPRSVLHRDISIDPSTYSNSGDDTPVEIQQLHPQGVENSNYIPEDASGRWESSNLSSSTEEEHLTRLVSEEMVRENEMREKKTNFIPQGSSERKDSSNLSTSDVEDKLQSANQKLICEDEIRPNEMMVIPESSSPKLSSPDSVLPKEIKSELPGIAVESSNFLIATDETNSLGSVSNQVIHEDEKKQNETKDISEGSSSSSSIHDSKEVLSKPVEESDYTLPVLASNEEPNSKGTGSEQVIPEIEKRENETKDASEGRLGKFSPESTMALSEGVGEISSGLPQTGEESSNLSTSPGEANSTRFFNEKIIHEDEKGQNEAKDIPEGSSQGLSSADATAAPSKPVDEISSRSLTMTNNTSDKLYDREAEKDAQPALLHPIEQVDKLNTPVINREENPLEITHKEEVLSSVDGEAQASTNPVTSTDSQGTSNELQKSAVQEDQTEDHFPSESTDENKGELNQPFKGESQISSPKKISEVEPSKSSEENDSANNHLLNTETEIKKNASGGRSSEEEVSGDPNTEQSLFTQMKGLFSL